MKRRRRRGEGEEEKEKRRKSREEELCWAKSISGEKLFRKLNRIYSAYKQRVRVRARQGVVRERERGR